MALYRYNHTTKELEMIASGKGSMIFDSTPTAGSNHAVTSDGIKTAIDNIEIELDTNINKASTNDTAAAAKAVYDYVENRDYGIVRDKPTDGDFTNISTFDSAIYRGTKEIESVYSFGFATSDVIATLDTHLSEIYFEPVSGTLETGREYIPTTYETEDHKTVRYIVSIGSDEDADIISKIVVSNSETAGSVHVEIFDVLGNVLEDYTADVVAGDEYTTDADNSYYRIPTNEYYVGDTALDKPAGGDFNESIDFTKLMTENDKDSTIPASNPSTTKVPTTAAVKNYVDNIEIDLDTNISSSSTNDTAAAAKAVYDFVEDQKDTTIPSADSSATKVPTTSATKTYVDGKIEAEMSDDVTTTKAVSGKGVKDYVDAQVDALASAMTSDVGDGGDIAILGFNNESNIYYSPCNAGITPTTETGPTQTGYQDNLAGGYVLTGAANAYRDKTFNRIKVFVMKPGMVRVGIVRGTGTDCKDRIARGCFKANPRYDDIDDYPLTLLDHEEASDSTCDGQSHTTLKKWLVAQFCAYPGVHVFDFPDEIITSPHEYIFMECRCGTIGYMKNNSGSDVVTNYGTVPNNTCHTGVSYNTAYVTWSNLQSGKFFLSRDMLQESAYISHGSATTRNGTAASQGFTSMAYNMSDKQEYVDNNFIGMLNIGIYKRGTNADLILNPIAEDAISSWQLPNGVFAYGPGGYAAQQKLAKTGMSIYGFDVIIKTPGDLSVFVFSSNDPATAKVVKHWTHRIRAVGKQFVHFPEDVILKEGEWIGFGGPTEAVSKLAPTAETVFEEDGVTFKDGYIDFAVPAYNAGAANTYDNWTCFGDNALSGRHQNEGMYSSAIGEFTHGFCHWGGTGGKYIPTTENRRGYFDFTDTTFVDNSSTGNPNANLGIALHVRQGKISKLEDLWCSVSGDSITTYRGIIPHTDDFASNNNAAGDYAICYPDAGSGLVNSPDNTWWGTLIKQTRMRFLINEAWSGSRVSGTDSATSSTALASEIRTKKLHNTVQTYKPNTNKKLGHPYGYPDIIFIMIGTNDIAGNVATGAYSNTDITSMDTILGAYETMVARHKNWYPYTKRIYFIIPRGTALYPYQNSNGFSIAQFADAAEYICKAFGSYFVPLSYFGAMDAINNSTVTTSSNTCIWIPNGNWVCCPGGFNTGSPKTACDYLHPAPVGNQIIANGLQRFVENIL